MYCPAGKKHFGQQVSPLCTSRGTADRLQVQQFDLRWCGVDVATSGWRVVDPQREY